MIIDSIRIRTLARLGQTRAFFSVAMPEIIEENRDVYIVTADLAFASGMDEIMRKNPDRIINVGIAEQNTISISSGLAAEGFNVYAVGYASFVASRSIEQVRLNLLATNANVKLVGFWSGVSLGLGVSHYAIEDTAFMRSMPGMTILSPADSLEAYKTAKAVADFDKPVYIRLSGGMETQPVYKEDYCFEIGKAIKLIEGCDAAIIATGLMVKESMKAADILREKGISCALYNYHTIHPLDTEALDEIFANYKLIVSVEEHAVRGGLGGAVAEYKTAFTNAPRHLILGFPNYFVKAGSQEYMWDLAGISCAGIVEQISSHFGKQ